MGKSKQTDETIEVLEISTGRLECCILGVTPLILHRMSEKARHELLSPRKKTAADKAGNLKHNPLEEYRASAYVSRDDKAPTRLLALSTMFKGAIRSVATDIPGAAKAQIGRLSYVESEHVPIFGEPKMFMSITRSSDMNKTPDVRTRCIVPEWACRFAITFVRPLLNEQAIVRLIAAAGIMRGIGDWRPEKGSGSFGQFRVVAEDDADFLRICKIGRKQQAEALETPGFYDLETEELYAWWTADAARRGFKIAKGQG